jgi:hypothetical protein
MAHWYSALSSSVSARGFEARQRQLFRGGLGGVWNAIDAGYENIVIIDFLTFWLLIFFSNISYKRESFSLW